MTFAETGFSDTIVAAATPPGPARRAVVRVSGPRAIAVLAGIFEPPLEGARGGRRIEGAIRLDDVRVEAAAWVFRAPRSYTGEDLVEIHTLGAPALVERLAGAIAAAGARPARAGEFTRRAFEMGRIDLSEAEAVLALGTTGDEREARAALLQLRGGLRREVESLRETLLDALAEIEAAIDFSQEDLEGELMGRAALLAGLDRARASARRLLGREAGRGPGAGRPAVLLFGPANSGKSSLFNALSGSERALVSPRAGTTRDALSADIDGVELIDCAGLDEGGTPALLETVDREAARRAEALLAAADHVLVVLDRAAPLGEAGRRALGAARARPRTIVLQKCDLPAVLDLGALDDEAPRIEVSAHTGAGLELLRAALARVAEPGDRAESGPAPNGRHCAALDAALRALDAAIARLIEDRAELAAIELRAALDALGEVTGAACAEDVLERVFARFCIGK